MVACWMVLVVGGEGMVIWWQRKFGRAVVPCGSCRFSGRFGMAHDIFISYRREGGFETARYLYDHLRLDGYDVTFDLDTLRNGRFDEALLSRIDECTDFIVVLSKGCFDRTLDPAFPRENDWMRRELGYAIGKQKNVVPIHLGEFVFPENLPEDIQEVRFLNAPPYSREYFDSFYMKLKNFLRSAPVPDANHAERRDVARTTSHGIPPSPRVPSIETCPICGKANVPTETFRCRQCGREGLCLRHQDPRTYRCEECEAAEKATRQEEERLKKKEVERWYQMGIDALEGHGGAQSDTEAVKWIRKAAEQGYAAGQVTLGQMYEEGRGVEQSDRRP